MSHVWRGTNSGFPITSTATQYHLLSIPSPPHTISRLLSIHDDKVPQRLTNSFPLLEPHASPSSSGLQVIPVSLYWNPPFYTANPTMFLLSNRTRSIGQSQSLRYFNI